MTVLPAGIQHGTPEGFAAGCRREKDCPALTEHGMCCQYAHVRSMTDMRYHRARQRDPRPAAIARQLGIKPPGLAEQKDAEREAAVDEQFGGKPPHFRYDDRHDLAKETRSNPTKETPMPTPADVAKTSKPLTAQPVPEISDDIVDEAPATPTPKKRAGHKPPPSASATLTKEERADCRAWAIAIGAQVGEKGRIPAAIVLAWIEAGSPNAAQPLAESSQDTAPQEDAGAPAIEEEVPAAGTPAAEVEEMGHPVDQEEQLDDDELEEAAADIVYEGMSEHGLYAGPDATDYTAPVEPAEFDAAMAAARERAELEQLNRDADGEPDLWPALAAEIQIIEDRLTRTHLPAERPEWADVTIPEDIRKARSIAARLEEENAQLQAALDVAIARWWAQVEMNNQLRIDLTAERSANAVIYESAVQLVRMKLRHASERRRFVRKGR